MDEARINKLRDRAESLQKTWLQLADMLRARPDKKVIVPRRRCTENARKCSRRIKELNAWQEQSESYLDDVEKQLDQLASSADRLLVTFGLSGHEPGQEFTKK